MAKDARPLNWANTETVHGRYKDLSVVARAFRAISTGHMEIQPTIVRSAERTRAHVFIVMLAYRLRLVLEEAWRSLDITVEKDLNQLTKLCTIQVMIGPEAECLFVSEPRDCVAKLVNALDISPSQTLPRRIGNEDTKRKLHWKKNNPTYKYLYLKFTRPTTELPLKVSLREVFQHFHV